jgi:hypothetical protein
VNQDGTARGRSAAFRIRSVVSRVSATGPCEPTQKSTARPLTFLPTWCGVVSGEAPYGPVCQCHWDGMQEVRGSNPLSSTPTKTAGQPACGCSSPGRCSRRAPRRSSTSGSRRAATLSFDAHGRRAMRRDRGRGTGGTGLSKRRLPPGCCPQATSVLTVRELHQLPAGVSALWLPISSGLMG